MKPSSLCLSALLLSSLLSSTAAWAETDGQKLSRLERDLQLIQRQISRGEATIVSSGDAQTEVRLSGIEDEIRNLRGKIEENEFQVRRTAENLDKLQKDVEMRFQDLTAAQTAAAPATETLPATAQSDAAAPVTTATTGTETPAVTGSSEFATPRDHYNHAFRLLNQTKYPEAAESFNDFTKKYPTDPLVGNAYYWQGETYYIRRDYMNAADMFRQGFEALPDGPKAADNLLKLGMSLSALKRNKEACVVLAQLSARYAKIAKSVAARAEQEQKRIGCDAA